MTGTASLQRQTGHQTPPEEPLRAFVCQTRAADPDKISVAPFPRVPSDMFI